MQAAASVLVIEDDPSLRLLCRVNLELEGFRVREAADLESARAELDAETPALVFLDMHLGGESSEGLLEDVVESGVPVIVMSGSADTAAYRGRVADVLGKPFEPSRLVACARRYVG
jgi:two-component system C4-dicarboxylate transport response regulator DctD